MFDVWQLMMVALIPYFLFVLVTVRMMKIMVGTLLFAVPYCLAEGAPFFHLAGTWWTKGSTILGMPSMVAYPVGIFTIALLAALFYLVPVIAHAPLRRKGRFSPIVFALSFALADYLRAMILFGGYTFGTMGYALIKTTYLKHVAAVTSVFGLTFVAVLFSSWCALLLYRFLSQQGNIFVRVRSMADTKWEKRETSLVVLVFLSVFIFGVYREIKGPPSVPPMRVAVIASTIRTEKSISEESYWMYRDLLLRALAKEPDLIVLPENVFPYFIIDEHTGSIVERPIVMIPQAEVLLNDFTILTKTHASTTFVVPTHTMRDKETYNSILIYRAGNIVGTYHKRYPVPFTEYAPLGLKLSLFEYISKGDPQQPLMIKGAAFDSAICSEIDHVPFRTYGAAFILSPSNDSALNGHEVIEMHDRNARMRALESGAYMLRLTRGGISSVIDSYGHPIASLQDTNDVIIVDVH
jgi:apolipoprotein N-acyltransferase